MSTYGEATCGEARGYLLDAFTEAGEKGLYLYEVYKVMEEFGITDKPVNRRIGGAALNELYDMGLIGYGRIPGANELNPEDFLNQPCNFYLIKAAKKREPLRPLPGCFVNPYEDD